MRKTPVQIGWTLVAGLLLVGCESLPDMPRNLVDDALPAADQTCYQTAESTGGAPAARGTGELRNIVMLPDGRRARTCVYPGGTVNIIAENGRAPGQLPMWNCVPRGAPMPSRGADVMCRPLTQGERPQRVIFSLESQVRAHGQPAIFDPRVHTEIEKRTVTCTTYFGSYPCGERTIITTAADRERAARLEREMRERRQRRAPAP
jgi:hypothetical protein